MGNMPIHIVAEQAKGKSYGRKAVWEAIRDLRTYTLAELRMRVHPVSQYIVEDFNTSLVKGGYVTKDHGERYKKATYTLVRDIGFIAPRLNKQGEELPETGQQVMWGTMKRIKTFTAAELMRYANSAGEVVQLCAVQDYLRHLHHRRYVVEIGKRKGGEPAVYRFVKNTGGKAPMVQRTKVLFDPNTGEAFALEPLGDE